MDVAIGENHLRFQVKAFLNHYPVTVLPIYQVIYLSKKRFSESLDILQQNWNSHNNEFLSSSGALDFFL